VKQATQRCYLFNNHLISRSSSWRSKWAAVSRFHLGVKIWPPSLSTGALEENALLYSKKRLFLRRT